MMSTWARLKKVYLFLAVIIILLSAWRVSDFQAPEMPPRPSIQIPDNLRSMPESEYEENYYDVYINGELSEQSDLILKDKSGRIYVPVSALKSANIDISKARIIKYLDQEFFTLSDFPLIKYEVDIENLALKLTVPLEYFLYHVVDMGASTVVHPPLPPWGGYFNYDFFGTNVGKSNNVSALFKINIFGPYGVGTTSFSATTDHSPRPYVRLLTTWIIDDPDKMKTISLGDNVSRATNWSGSLNYGGVQWGTNFATQPTYITFPLPGFRGAAIVPTAMDLFINNSLATSQKVAPGVYDITNIPMVDGYGNVKIITKDILGRDQIVNANYYISTILLKKDLVNYTVDLGIIRQDLGVYSNNYSQAIAAFTYGKGLTDSTTLQFHGEALSYVQAAGLTLTQLISSLGIATGSIAVSKSYLLGRGATFLLGFQRQTQGLSFGFNTQYNTAHFSQSGVQPGTVSPKLVARLFASYPIGRSNITVNYTKQLNRLSSSVSYLTGTFSTSLFNVISLGFTMIDTLSGPGKKSYFLNLSYALDDSTYLNGGYNNTEGTQNKTLQLIRQLPTGPGYGYNLAVQRGNTNRDIAGLSFRNDIGTYIFNSAASDGSTTNTLSVSGAVIYMSKNFKLARSITTSFGYIHIPDFENIDIYYENQLIGRTDKNGYAFVPTLLPYQKLKINIDPNTVPLNATIDKYEDYVIAYRDAGALAEFKITTIHSAIFSLKQETGSYVPEGADITVEDSTETFVSGANGQVFVTNLPDKFTGHVVWGGGGCSFNVSLPAPQESNPIPDIGVIICKAETPKAAVTNSETTEPKQEAAQVAGNTSPNPLKPVTTNSAPVINNTSIKHPAANGQIQPQTQKLSLQNRMCVPRHIELTTALLNKSTSILASYTMTKQGIQYEKNYRKLV